MVKARGLVGLLLAGIVFGGCAARAPAPVRRRQPTVHAGHGRLQRLSLAVAPPAIHGAAARRAAIPILMYHVVSAAPSGAAFPQLWVAPGVFAREMATLQHAGYHAITLATAVRAWRRGGPLPRRPIVLSFDDGYRSDYTHARPVLMRLGWPGVLNLALENVERGGITDPEVRRLIAAGWEIDSHTMTHPNLTTLPPIELRHELVDSRAQIRRRFGQPAEFFCYPFGHYDARVVAAVRAAGYRAATTTDEGLGIARDVYVLKRIRVNGSDTPASLLARLRAYQRQPGHRPASRDAAWAPDAQSDDDITAFGGIASVGRGVLR